MRELALGGLIAIAFGVGSWYATRGAAEGLAWFHWANLGGGALALGVAAVLAVRRLGARTQPAQRALIGRGLAGILFALAVAVAAERAAHRFAPASDWTLDASFTPAEATLRACEALDGVEALLFYDEQDTRIRSTRLLLQELERHGCLRVRALRLDEEPEELERYAVMGSNHVVLRYGERFENVERPTEGTLYEALYRLRSLDGGVLYIARGGGDGDIERTDDGGYSGLAQALITEGYRIHAFVPAQGVPIPEDAAAVVWIAPQRSPPEAALDELRAYLERGGRLVVFLEPGVEAGLGEVLANWGLRSPDGVLLDPASGRMDGDAPGVNPLAYHYGTHPIARGLGSDRMTFFRGARSFELRKPRVEDDLREVVLASPRSWISPDLSVLRGGAAPTAPAESELGYHPLAVAARYPRESGETRIVAFGDADFASNRQLRTLYNLDLVLNAVHWAVEREPEIKLLPKARVSGGAQFALPIQNTLTRFYGVGLLLPELLLLAGALIWVRTRSN